MAKKVLDKIKEAEEEASGIVEVAKKDAQRILGDAHKEAEAIIEKTVTSAHKEAQTIIKEKIARAEGKATQIRERTNKEIKKLKECTIPKVKKAVAWIKNSIIPK